MVPIWLRSSWDSAASAREMISGRGTAKCSLNTCKVLSSPPSRAARSTAWSLKIRRVLISAAAFSVNVSATSRGAATPCASRAKHRRSISRVVLPVPAPASTTILTFKRVRTRKRSSCKLIVWPPAAAVPPVHVWRAAMYGMRLCGKWPHTGSTGSAPRG